MRAATFTTYINAQTDPGLEQAFTRQAQIATSSYATITRAAEQATRATAGLLGARGTQGAGVATQVVQQRAAALTRTVAAAAEAERATTRLATATKREIAATQTAAREHANLARGLTTTSVALNVVSGRLDPVASRLNTLTRAVTDLTGVQLGLAAFGATLFAIGRTANTYANLEARVRPFFETQKGVNAAMNDIVGIAQRSRSALEPIVDVYTRLTTVGQGIGLNRRSIAQITEISTKAASVGGGSAQARDAALMQFGQALSGDFKAAGQEINSLKEQAPVLFQAILRGFKNADGTIGTTLGKFKAMAEAGELSTAKVLDAVRRSASYIDDMAARVPNTLSRAGTELANATTIAFGRIDQSIGFTSTLADGLSLIARNMRVIISLAAGVGTAFAAIKIGGLATDAAASVRSFMVMREAITQLNVQRQAGASLAINAARNEVIAIEAENKALMEQIALLDRKAAAARGDITRAINDPSAGLGPSGATKKLAEAEDELADTMLRRDRLVDTVRANEEKLAGTHVEAARQTKRLEQATENLSKRTGVLRGAAGSLVSFLGGPWGIAFAAAATAVFLLATAESAAERNARTMEDAQRKLANAIDFNTGKIYEQNKAKLAGLQLDQRSGQTAARANYRTARTALGNVADTLVGNITTADQFGRTRTIANRQQGDLSPAERRAYSLLSRYRGGEAGLGADTVVAEINRLAESEPKLKRVAEQVTKIGEQVVDAARKNNQFIGTGNLLAGRNDEANRSLAENGYATGGRRSATAGKPRTKAQIEAAAAAEAAQSDVERARAELKTIRANGQQPGEDDVAYQHRLAAALQNVKAATEGAAAARRNASAGRATARKEARDAIQDSLDEAKAKRDAALLDLNKRGLNPVSDEFLQARIAILNTYDAEVNKIDASRAASSSAAAQQIADAQKVAAAAQTAAEKRRDILAQYDEAPRARDRANDQIDDLQKFVDTAVDGVAFIGKTKGEIAEIAKLNPLGTGIYTQEMADADARRIEEGVRKPIRDLDRDFERFKQIASLRLQGREAEAAALETRNSLLDGGNELSDAEYQKLIRNERQQARINDVLDSRQRIVSLIQGSLDNARDTAEGVFTALQSAGNASDVGDIFLGAIKDFQSQFARVQSRQLVEKLFAGSDEKLRALLEGKSGVDRAISQFGESADTLTSTTSRVEAALDRVAAAANGSAARMEGAPPPAAGTGAGVAVSPNASAAERVAAFAATGGGLLGALDSAMKRSAANDNRLPGEVEVVAPTRAPARGEAPLPTVNTPSAKSAFNVIGSNLFGPVAKGLDGFVDKIKGKKFVADGNAVGGFSVQGSTFFKKIGDSFGTALQGAGQGAIASGFAKALGVKQSGAGAAVGGAIGSFLPIPGGGFIGGLIGGTLGGLFGGKKNQGTASVSLNQYGEVVGSTGAGKGGAQIAAATGSAKSVADGINQIAQQLGATISGLPNITIGSYNGYSRVSTTGAKGELSYGKNKNGLVDFGKDGEAAAIEYAIRYSITNAVVTGISQASKNILKSGQDLQQAISKAVAIEAIPKRLMQLQNPVQYAVMNLNEEFTKLISYLKEGGASAQQFADASKLYDLERAKALETATTEATDQITQFLKDMVSGSASPLNKRTTFENAAKDLEAFKADITGGKAVDQSALLSAARNFQDASRALNGSSQSFFDDFDSLRALLEKARVNIGTDVAPGPDLSGLPASPFANDSTVQAAIASLTKTSVSATETQTDALGRKLDAVVDAIYQLAPTGYAAGGGGSANRLLPGYANRVAA